MVHWMTVVERQQSGLLTPHLSVVAVSRNDDHGIDMRGRMQHFVNGFIAQCRKHRLDAELILVEWNPPPDRPPLERMLVWPADFGPATVRIVTVPASAHAAFPHSAALPLFQMIGKNVGIRRARGRYVVATNVDILFDDESICYLRDHLEPGTMVRADRYDVPGDIAKGVPFNQILAECRARFFHVNTRLGTFDVRRRRILGRNDGWEAHLLALYTEIAIFGFADSARRANRRYSNAALAATKNFGRSIISGVNHLGAALRRLTNMVAVSPRVLHRAARASWEYCRQELAQIWPLKTMPGRGYRYAVRTFRHLRVAIQSLPILRKARSAMRRLSRAAFRSMSYLRRACARAWRIATALNPWSRRSASDRRFERSRWLHTNACGDFTLLSRDDWHRLRGYPEWPIFSWHVDSTFMFAANAHDIREVALGRKYKIYHIEHSSGSGWSLEGAGRLFARLDRSGIPYLGEADIKRLQKQFAENPHSAIVNGEDWGLVGITCPEHQILPGHSMASNADRRERSPAALRPRDSITVS